MSPGEDYTENARHELEEELGIITKPDSLRMYKIFRCDKGKEFQGIHYLVWNGDSSTLKPEKDEVDQVTWIPLDELHNKLVINKDNDWSIIGYERKLLEYFKDLDLALVSNTLEGVS